MAKTWREAVGEWMFEYAYEIPSEWSEYVDDGVEWEWSDIEIDHVGFKDRTEDRPPYAEAHGTVVGSVTEQTHSATRINPPSYKSHDVDIGVTVRFEPTEGGFDGQWYVHVEQLSSNPTNPPTPEPYDV